LAKWRSTFVWRLIRGERRAIDRSIDQRSRSALSKRRSIISRWRLPRDLARALAREQRVTKRIVGTMLSEKTGSHDYPAFRTGIMRNKYFYAFFFYDTTCIIILMHRCRSQARTGGRTDGRIEIVLIVGGNGVGY